MAGEVRTILNQLDGQMLRKLCEERGLQVSGSVDEKRSRLSRSFRGRVDELLPHLHRENMIAALEIFTFSLSDGRRGELIGLRNANRDELRKAMERIFVEDWVPAAGQIQPLGSSSLIRIAWKGAETESDETPGPEYEDEEEESPQPIECDRATDGPEVADFYEWLADYLATRGASTLMIKTLVNRLGHFRAEERLRTRAVQDLGQVLARGGFVTDPDLSQLQSSPGIDARVRVSRRSGPSSRASTDWQPVPKLTAIAGADSAPTPTVQPSMPAIASDFERAATKLKFLITVAASIARPTDDVRLNAVEYASEALTLSNADKLRLRALGHQYAAGHEDLRVTVRQLRVALASEERGSLLKQLRGLAPPTTELEELIQIYATDLAVTADLLVADTEPAPFGTGFEPETPAGPASSGGVRENALLDQVFEPEPEPRKAGGARANPALDDIFSVGDDS